MVVPTSRQSGEGQLVGTNRGFSGRRSPDDFGLVFPLLDCHFVRRDEHDGVVGPILRVSIDVVQISQLGDLATSSTRKDHGSVRVNPMKDLTVETTEEARWVELDSESVLTDRILPPADGFTCSNESQ